MNINELLKFYSHTHQQQLNMDAATSKLTPAEYEERMRKIAESGKTVEEWDKMEKEKTQR